MKLLTILSITISLLSPLNVLHAQQDSLRNKLKFTSDFRFRIEEDWNSRNAAGEMRKNRSRLRYRMRLGLIYTLDKHSRFGGRIRTGNLNDQQGPHLSLGGGSGEFGLSQIGFEKLHYTYQNKYLTAWVGKNKILLQKEHELFWNDNVFPEGLAFKLEKKLKKEHFIHEIKLHAGHFIIKSNGGSFASDSYFQLVQPVLGLLKNRLNLAPAFYYFRQVGNLPDNKHNYSSNYSIIHCGLKAVVNKKATLRTGFDYYYNAQDYTSVSEIPASLQDQNQGWAVWLKYGKLKKKGDFSVHLYYAYLEKFAVVDYFAQNDWARWDYSSKDAAGARLTNMKGTEIRVAYAFNKKFNLILRSYFVSQIIAEGNFKETGNRIRLDMNIGF